MTLKELLYILTETGIKQKLVNYSQSGLSLRTLNSITTNDYPLLYITPSGNDQDVTENTTTYSVTLYLFDRLLIDDTNGIDILSNSIDILKNYIKGLSKLDSIVSVSDSYTIRNFTETNALSDRVNGVYATIKITTLNNNICYEE